MNSKNKNELNIQNNMLPKFNLNLKVKWYNQLIGGIMTIIVWIISLLVVILNAEAIGNNYIIIIIVLSVIFLPLAIVMFIWSVMRKNATISLKVDKKKETLNIDTFWSNRQIKSNSYNLKEIDRFDVLYTTRTTKTALTRKFYHLVLNFSSGSPKYINKDIKEELAIDYATTLNEFLVNNTNLDKNSLKREIIPEQSVKQEKTQQIIALIGCLIIIGALSFYGIMWLLYAPK